MQQQANFRFYGTLNDFLPIPKRNVWLAYGFNGLPAIKDAIEAIGIPHVEADAIRINGSPAAFYDSLHTNDQVEVYPAELTKEHPELQSLRADWTMPDKFVADFHLGALVRLLRLLGFDTVLDPNYTDQDIAQIAEIQNRIVLTRDIFLLKQKRINWGYWLRSQHTRQQLAEVMARFSLASKFHPFNRCLACNGLIAPVSKAMVAEKLPHNTALYFDEFFQCADCKRVYWKGSHYERMLKTLEDIQASI